MNHPQASAERAKQFPGRARLFPGRARLPPSQPPGRDGVPTYRGALLLCLMLAQGLLSSIPLSAQETTEQAVQAGRDALNGRRSYPWYDRQKDAARRIELQTQLEKQPEKKLVAAKPVTPTAPARPVGVGWNTWSLGPLLQVLGLSVLLLALGVAAYFISKAFMNQEVEESRAVKVVEVSSDVDRVENLPFTLDRPTGDFLDEARRLYDAGRYAEAIIYYYSYLLVQLDRRHVIRLAKGKTNRQYLREARRLAPVAGVLEPTMVAFEEVFFGHHPLPRERFEQCWERREAFLRELEQAPAAT